MNLLEKLDAIMPELQPLAPHCMASADLHSREHYAMLLAALLQTGNTVSEAQSRVFSMLLASMQLPGTPAKYLQWAANVEQAVLKEALLVCQANQDCAAALLLDATILMRLTGRLNKEQQQTLSSTFNLLRVDEKELLEILAYVQLALGTVSETSSIEHIAKIERFTTNKETLKKLQSKIAKARGKNFSEINSNSIAVKKLSISNVKFDISENSTYSGSMHYDTNIKGDYSLGYYSGKSQFDLIISYKFNWAGFFISHIKPKTKLDNNGILGWTIPFPQYTQSWQEFIHHHLTRLYPTALSTTA